MRAHGERRRQQLKLLWHEPGSFGGTYRQLNLCDIKAIIETSSGAEVDSINLDELILGLIERVEELEGRFA